MLNNYFNKIIEIISFPRNTSLAKNVTLLGGGILEDTSWPSFLYCLAFFPEILK